MKRLIQSIALLGMITGAAVMNADRAEACASLQYLHLGEICQCNASLFGYEWCSSSTYYCQVFGSGCGDGPGTLPP